MPSPSMIQREMDSESESINDASRSYRELYELFEHPTTATREQLIDALERIALVSRPYFDSEDAPILLGVAYTIAKKALSEGLNNGD